MTSWDTTIKTAIEKISKKNSIGDQLRSLESKVNLTNRTEFEKIHVKKTSITIWENSSSKPTIFNFEHVTFLFFLKHSKIGELIVDAENTILSDGKDEHKLKKKFVVEVKRVIFTSVLSMPPLFLDNMGSGLSFVKIQNKNEETNVAQVLDYECMNNVKSIELTGKWKKDDTVLLDVVRFLLKNRNSTDTTIVIKGNYARLTDNVLKLLLLRTTISSPGMVHLKTGNSATKMIIADDVLGTICMLIQKEASDDDIRDRMFPIPY